jgi:hypothetical protein
LSFFAQASGRWKRTMADIFRAGDRAPWSGVYKATHANGHAPAQDLTVLHGESFPTCLECSEGVVFRLVTAAVHINAHPMFRRF